MFALKIFKVERKKQDQWQHFVAEVDMKNKRIFCRGSQPDLFCKKRPLKYFAKLTGKHMYRSLFFKKNSGYRPATFVKKRFMHRFFSVKF